MKMNQNNFNKQSRLSQTILYADVIELPSTQLTSLVTQGGFLKLKDVQRSHENEPNELNC